MLNTLRNLGASDHDVMHVENLFAVGNVDGDGKIETGNDVVSWCRQRNRHCELYRHGKRNWFLDKGIIFDLREPDVQGERWDMRRRADRRHAWREMAKEEPLMIVLGDVLGKRGSGEHRRFCVRVCKDQSEKGRYYVQQGGGDWGLEDGVQVRGRSGTSNSAYIRDELKDRKRCCGNNQEDDKFEITTKYDGSYIMYF